MRIADILARKGAAVVSVGPDDLVTTLLHSLAAHDVGAAVVLDGGTLAGIVSERDIVRALQHRGAAVLSEPVSRLMTRVVATCAPSDRVDTVTVTMTDKRIRHLPVLDEGQNLIGIVSIGDAVKSRIDELESDREQLQAYITG